VRPSFTPTQKGRQLSATANTNSHTFHGSEVTHDAKQIVHTNISVSQFTVLSYIIR